MEWHILTPEEVAALDTQEPVLLPPDDADHEHIWESINTSRGRAYQCKICWDRTD